MEIEAHIEVGRTLTKVDTGGSGLRKTITEQQTAVFRALESLAINVRIGVTRLCTDLRFDETTEHDALNTVGKFLHFVGHLREIEAEVKAVVGMVEECCVQSELM